MPEDHDPWLECQACYTDFRFDESPAVTLCAECAAWHDWLAGAVAPE